MLNFSRSKKLTLLCVIFYTDFSFSWIYIINVQKMSLFDVHFDQKNTLNIKQHLLSQVNRSFRLWMQS